MYLSNQKIITAQSRFFEEPENIELLLQMIEALETDAKIVNGDNHE